MWRRWPRWAKGIAARYTSALAGRCSGFPTPSLPALDYLRRLLRHCRTPAPPVLSGASRRGTPTPVLSGVAPVSPATSGTMTQCLAPISKAYVQRRIWVTSMVFRLSIETGLFSLLGYKSVGVQRQLPHHLRPDRVLPDAPVRNLHPPPSAPGARTCMNRLNSTCLGCRLVTS